MVTEQRVCRLRKASGCELVVKVSNSSTYLPSVCQTARPEWLTCNSATTALDAACNQIGGMHSSSREALWHCRRAQSGARSSCFSSTRRACSSGSRCSPTSLRTLAVACCSSATSSPRFAYSKSPRAHGRDTPRTAWPTAGPHCVHVRRLCRVPADWCCSECAVAVRGARLARLLVGRGQRRARVHCRRHEPFPSHRRHGQGRRGDDGRVCCRGTAGKYVHVRPA